MTEPQPDYTAPASEDPEGHILETPLGGFLPVDREVEIAISSAFPASSLTGLDLNDSRTLLGLGRALTRRVLTLQRYVDELAAFTVESERAQAPIVAAIEAIEKRFADHIRARRKTLRENNMTVPGIGEWSSRRQNARWAIDNKLLIESLGADETERYTEQPPPPARKLKRDDYITEVLDPLLLFDEEKNEIGIDAAAPPTGVERIPADVGVTYSLNL